MQTALTLLALCPQTRETLLVLAYGRHLIHVDMSLAGFASLANGFLYEHSKVRNEKSFISFHGNVASVYAHMSYKQCVSL